MAISGTNALEELSWRSRHWSFRPGRSDEDATVIVGAADQDFFPRLGMRGSKLVPLRKRLDFFWCQLPEQLTRQIAQQSVPESINPFEMFEQQDEPLEMRRREATIDTIKWVRHGVCNRAPLEIALQIQDIFPALSNLGMLRLRDTPDKQA